MNRGKKLLILVAVLAVAIAAVLLVSKLAGPETTPMSEESGETILQVQASSITNLKWTWEAERFDFDYTGAAWTCNIQQGYVPDTAKMAKILVELSDIRAQKVINEPKDLALYGLEQPSCTVTVGDKVLKLGIYSSLSDTYYFSMGDGKVYMVKSSLYNSFAHTRNELVQFEAIPDMTNLTGITVENKNGVTTLENLGENDLTYSSHYTWFIKDDPAMISQEVVEGLLMYLQDLAWLQCLDSGATDLSAYGLDAPMVRCTATSADGSFTFLIGSEHTQGYYACVEGSQLVYLIDATAAQVFDAVSADMLKCTDVLKMDWATVTSVDLIMDGQTVVLTAGADGVWTIDGEATDGANVLEAINLMVTEKEEAVPVEGLTEELKLVMHRNTERFSTVTLTFYRHDGTNCIMQLNDNAPVLILRDDVIALKEAFNTLILG